MYDVEDRHHAAAILANEFPQEFSEICSSLINFRLTRNDIRIPSGNESLIPKKLSTILRPLGWRERKLKTKMLVDDVETHVDTHKIDFLKERVALEMEWNSKDQTFDRDLFAFRTFFEYNQISVGILVTRSSSLDSLFDEMGSEVKQKYGASPTNSTALSRVAAGGLFWNCLPEVHVLTGTRGVTKLLPTHPTGRPTHTIQQHINQPKHPPLLPPD